METCFTAYAHLPSYPVSETGLPHRSTVPPLMALCVPLFWLFKLLVRWKTGGLPEDYLCETSPTARDIPQGNRRQRRRLAHTIKADKLPELKKRIMVTRILSRGLSRSRFLEKKARLFIHGRVRIYGLRFRGSRLRCQARLSCFDHGWWQTPDTSMTNGGMWDAQLPPN